MQRRNFLKMSAAGLGSAAGFASNLMAFNAFAADVSDYKALVCVFLPGGQDGHDLIIPFDPASNAKYAAIRAEMLSGYEQSRYRDNLLSLSGATSNGTLADGREFALPSEMIGLHNLYANNTAAVIGNIGPLIEPTTRTSYRNSRAKIPLRLFSHNDQQSTWMASNPEGVSSGWGGRMGDIVQAANANDNASFTLVSTNGNRIYTTGNTLNGYALTSSGGLRVNYRAATKEAVLGFGIEHNNLFKRDLAKKTFNEVTNGELMRDIFLNAPNPSTTFPSTSLGEQLKSVAKMIASRNTLGMKRQIFFIQHLADYDTHSNQMNRLPFLQQQVSEAMHAFYNETLSMGISDQVTTFTASDFGRTLVPNSSGTDHGWGSHHLVVGGAVNGGQILGNIPEAEVDHEQDVGRGRLIPEVSVDQMAFSMARWFGLTESEAKEVLPNATNFDYAELYDLFVGLT